MNDALELMDQLRTALRERDEARDALFRADQGALRVEEERDRLQRERDEARAELAGLPAWQKGCEQALGDLADAEEAIARLYTERDEARAEVDRLTDERDELLVRVANQDAELRATREVHNEARAKVDRLKLSARLWADDIDAVSNAYRRGAEAMREACIAWARAPENDWEHLAHELENMPIPEEP